MRVEHGDGVSLPDAGWRLDPRRPADFAFVSHAHFDHMGRHAEFVCSVGTERLMRARLPSAFRESVCHALPFRERRVLRGCEVELRPAGHVLGSAMLWLAQGGESLLYTGDFKLREGLASERCDPCAADLLVMETTYGRPHYVFPPAEETIGRLVAFCQDAAADGETAVLFGYSLGKSQEVLRAIASAGLPVRLHPTIAELTAVYASLGVEFPDHGVFDGVAHPGEVLLLPPSLARTRTVERLRRKRTAAITGWALDPSFRFRGGCDAGFPLSDHADYRELLELVERVEPRRVLTLHGFAADFARDLRRRGVEAWALSENNQLELDALLDAPRANRSAARSGSAHHPATAPGSGTRQQEEEVYNTSPSSGMGEVLYTGGEPPRAGEGTGSAGAGEGTGAGAGTFGWFAAACDAVRDEAGSRGKVRLIAGLLGRLDEDEAGQAACFLAGRAFSQAEGRPLQVGAALIRTAVSEAAGVREPDFRAAYARHRDLGETVGELLAGRSGEPVSLRDVRDWLGSVAAARGPSVKGALLSLYYTKLDGRGARYLTKVITGDLRIGFKEGWVEEAVGADPAAVRDANMLCGDLGEVVRLARAGRLGDAVLRPLHPVKVMLASPEPDAASVAARFAAPMRVEDKLDGIRCQLHKRGGRVALFSRDLKDLGAAFPEVADAARAWAFDAVLDGELVAFEGGRALPFAELQRRLGRREADLFLPVQVPLSYVAFDLLWHEGETLLQRPLAERSRRLAKLGLGAPFQCATVREAATAEDLDVLFQRAREAGNEGLMIKDPASPYQPGRRGQAWVKLKKAFATLDVVVTAVEYGHGKRREVLSDYTFAVRDGTGVLRNIGKAYSGLTDAEIAELTGHFLRRVIEVKGRVHRVDPDVVLEVAFDAIQPSRRHDSGYALRFPRIKSIRRDKTPDEIDTLEFCRRLAGG